MSLEKAPGVGIEPTTSWFRARRHYQQQLPRNAFLPARGEGLEPPQPGSKPGGLPLADPRVCHRFDIRVPCGNRTGHHGSSVVRSAWKADAFAARPRAQGGRRGSRTLKAHRSTVFETAAIARAPTGKMPVGRLPFRIRKSCGGRNRTCEGALNRRLPVPAQAPPQSESGWQDLNLRSQAPRACAIPGFATPCQSRRGRI